MTADLRVSEEQTAAAEVDIHLCPTVINFMILQDLFRDKGLLSNHAVYDI